MSVRVAKSAGFCFGVNRAVELVEQAAKAGEQVCTLGPIIHNRHAVARFEEMGVKVIDSPQAAEAGQTVIIRSHGVTKAVYEQLEATGAKIVDATCPFVKRIHGIVEKAEQEGIVVPCDDFGVSGYVRIAYCVDKQRVVGALPAFKKLAEEYKA